MGIRQKKKICESCNQEQYLFSRGRCKMCALREDSKPIKKQSAKNKVYKKERGERRAIYFEHHIPLCHKSEESGRTIIEANRSNIAHLIDKGRHPSLEDNLENYVYLTLEEHTQFDNLLFKHDFDRLEKEFENSWKIACERYKKLVPLCKERTKFILALTEYLNIKL